MIKHMRGRLRFVLPLSQITIAIALVASNFLRANTIENPSWNKPDIQFCYALNAPAAFVIDLLAKATNGWIPAAYPIDVLIARTLYLLFVALLWYLVSLEMNGGGQSVLASKTRARAIVDGLAIVFGVVLGVVGFLVRRQFGYISAYSDFLAVFYFLWGAAFVVFYGHDLWARTRRGAERATV